MFRFLVLAAALLLLSGTSGSTQEKKETVPSKATLARVGDVTDKDFPSAVGVYERVLKDAYGVPVYAEILADVSYLKGTLPQRKLDNAAELKERLSKLGTDAAQRFIWSVQLHDSLLKRAETIQERADMAQLIKENGEKHFKKFEADIQAARKNGWQLPAEPKK